MEHIKKSLKSVGSKDSNWDDDVDVPDVNRKAVDALLHLRSYRLIVTLWA